MGWDWYKVYTGLMFDACFPFGPSVTSNDTFWPSCSDLNPEALIAEKCANKSSPPWSGVMKPKPFASLNHFTVPVAITLFLLFVLKGPRAIWILLSVCLGPVI